MQEKELFFEIISEAVELGNNTCYFSNKIITVDTAKAVNFAHFLPKGMYKKYKLKSENIFLVSNTVEHHLLDAFKDYIIKRKGLYWIQLNILNGNLKYFLENYKGDFISSYKEEYKKIFNNNL